MFVSHWRLYGHTDNTIDLLLIPNNFQNVLRVSVIHYRELRPSGASLFQPHDRLSLKTDLPEVSRTALPTYLRRVIMPATFILIMSATLSGLIILENPRPVDGSPSSMTFDGQMWLMPGRSVTGEFRYYNSSNESFSDVGLYFAWIHVSKISTTFSNPCSHLTDCEIRPT